MRSKQGSPRVGEGFQCSLGIVVKVYTTSGSIETPIDRSLVPCACGCGDGLAQPSVCCGSMQGLVSKCFSICATPKPNSSMYYIV